MGGGVVLDHSAQVDLVGDISVLVVDVPLLGTIFDHLVDLVVCILVQRRPHGSVARGRGMQELTSAEIVAVLVFKLIG
jgi:hypothetical protein